MAFPGCGLFSWFIRYYIRKHQAYAETDAG